MSSSGPRPDHIPQGVVALVRPDIEHWGREDDDRWRADLADLQGELRRKLPREVQDPGVASGGRGAAELTDVLVSLGSAGAITAMVEVIKAWIVSKPGHRTVTVSIDTSATSRTVVVDADGLGAQELTTVATTALGPPGQG